ncbi:MAG: hypothetical protein ACYDCC_01710 [Actinomycetota bacterium]
MLFWEITDASGNITVGQYEMFFGGQVSTFEVRNGSTDIPIASGDQTTAGSTSHGISEEIGDPENAHTFRFGVATWGSKVPASITVSLNNAPVQLIAGDASRVSLVQKKDFIGGALISAGGFGDIASESQYSINGDGQMMGYFLPSSLIADATISNPRGTRAFTFPPTYPIETNSPDGYIAEPGSGLWTFTIKAAIDGPFTGGTPALWLMDFPS